LLALKENSNAITSMAAVKKGLVRNFVINKNLYSLYTKYIYKDSTIFYTEEDNFRLNLIDSYNDNLIVGNEEHIYNINIKTKEKKVLNYNFSNEIKAIPEGVFIGTNSNGLLFVDYKLNILDKVNLPSVCINSLYYNQSKKLLYVGTNNSLLVYEFNKNKLRLLNTITSENGLISGKIISISEEGGNGDVYSQNGISKILDVLHKNNDTAEIDIDFFDATNDKTLSEKSIFLKRDNNNFSVRTSLNGFNINANMFAKKYSLELSNKPDNFKVFNEKILTFKDLQPGNYTFKCFTYNFETNKASKIKTLSIVIKPYYWETLWFRIVSILLLLITILLLFTYYKKKSIEKLNLENDMIFMEMRALKSQMSPHFIFNIINSLQSSVLLEDEIKVNYLFNKFSKLLRSTLNIVNNESINLFSEIKYLKNYIELENYRRNNDVNVEYSIEKLHNLENITIPVMLIQPVIENIFLHAFNASIENKKIKITVYKKEKHIHFIVEDNGIGYVAKQSKTTHKSIAIETILKPN
jgi:hypothetical protein